MNKAQIKAELRRSACEDDDPAAEISDAAYLAARKEFWLNCDHPSPYALPYDDCRTFFLLVAEAL